MKHDIMLKYEKIGYIQLVDYMLGKMCIPQIEYHLEEDYRNKGIMSKELPKYLKECKRDYKKYGSRFGNPTNRMIATVEKENVPSIKLLERNGFLKIKDFDNHYSYIAQLDLNIEFVEKMAKYFYECRKQRELRENPQP
jgi:RimJ/RimL family protein N-acetyltransferase